MICVFCREVAYPDASITPMTHSLEFLAGGGSVGNLMRSKDWSTSPLGPPESWPQSLRTVVGLLLRVALPDVRRVGAGAGLPL